ncbi:MAG: serine hydrolase [Calditrichaeota bacterium]|nr:serine hydrolase [Calditrichota bacterium]
MYKLFFFIIINFLSTGCRNMHDTNDLKTQIQNKFSTEKGTFALAFKTVEKDPIEILINADDVFHAASTMKTPVMVEAFKQQKAGRFNLDDSVIVKNEFKSIVDGSLFSLDISRDGGEQLYGFIGKKRKVYDLVYDMIIHSSNLATNIVIEYLGAENVTSTMRDLGALNIQVLRGVEDIKAFDEGLNNTTTARDLMIIFEKIASGQAVDQESSRKMSNILFDQQYNEIIPALLPQEVRVAHKTGSISGVQHDSGIVFLPDGRKYVLVLLSKNLENSDSAVKMMAEISLMLYQFIQ